MVVIEADNPIVARNATINKIYSQGYKIRCDSYSSGQLFLTVLICPYLPVAQSGFSYDKESDPLRGEIVDVFDDHQRKGIATAMMV